eukprot:TRINITY_DN9288_c0_g1_i1.p1 TRINITY_DN9288_c0_g1~~TRINITY_DN9288_c0_g1_i1.p1  ORF type:complete len:984 (-),score=183.07 TRINITY_DN9288_c0_g1_i1:368-3229(-)
MPDVASLDLFNTVRSVMQRQGTLKDVEKALDGGASPDTWKGPLTPLRCAVQMHNPRLLAMLLSRRADANATDSKGVAPLHMAAFDGKSDCVKILLDAGADANLQDRHGQTPLFFSPSRHVCEILLSKRADLNIQNSRRQSALHLAAHAGLDDTVAWFAGTGDDALLNLPDDKGISPMHYAKNSRVTSTMTALQKKGNVRLKDLKQKRLALTLVSRDFRHDKSVSKENTSHRGEDVEATTDDIAVAKDNAANEAAAIEFAAKQAAAKEAAAREAAAKEAVAKEAAAKEAGAKEAARKKAAAQEAAAKEAATREAAAREIAAKEAAARDATAEEAAPSVAAAKQAIGATAVSAVDAAVLATRCEGKTLSSEYAERQPEQPATIREAWLSGRNDSVVKESNAIPSEASAVAEVGLLIGGGVDVVSPTPSLTATIIDASLPGDRASSEATAPEGYAFSAASATWEGEHDIAIPQPVKGVKSPRGGSGERGFQPIVNDLETENEQAAKAQANAVLDGLLDARGGALREDERFRVPPVMSHTAAVESVTPREIHNCSVQSREPNEAERSANTTVAMEEQQTLLNVEHNAREIEAPTMEHRVTAASSVAMGNASMSSSAGMRMEYVPGDGHYAAAAAETRGDETAPSAENVPSMALVPSPASEGKTSHSPVRLLGDLALLRARELQVIVNSAASDSSEERQIQKEERDGCVYWQVTLKKQNLQDKFGFMQANGKIEFETRLSVMCAKQEPSSDDDVQGLQGPELLIVRRVHEGGLLERWNKKHPEAEVCPHDRILSVNGEISVEAMQREIKTRRIHMHLCRYPEHFSVTLKKEQRRMLGFKFERPGHGQFQELRISEVLRDGLLADYNAQQTALGRYHAVVLPDMRIEAANDVRGDAHRISDALKASEIVDLEVRRAEGALFSQQQVRARLQGLWCLTSTDLAHLDMTCDPNILPEFEEL